VVKPRIARYARYKAKLGETRYAHTVPARNLKGETIWQKEESARGQY
jgi:hypothetical protein